MDLLTREIKTESEVVRRFQSLTTITLYGDLFHAQYQNAFELPDGAKLLGLGFSADRSLDVVKGNTVDFNGVPISLTDFITIAAAFAEKYRIEDEANKPPDDGGVVIPLVP